MAPGPSALLVTRGMKRAITSIVLVFITCIVGAIWYLVNVYKDLPVDPAWALPGDTEIPAGAVTVRFSGTSTLLFSDGSSQWMVDGWFSRPGPWQLAFGNIAPDMEAITYVLEANQVSNLQAVIPAHSHYDHAMDSPEVARRTGAVLMGSQSTANIGRGWGLPDQQIEVLANRTPVTVGAFTITPIESRHLPFTNPEMQQRLLQDPEITAPLTPPASVFDYRLGKAYIFHVNHPKGNFVVVGSAGYEPGALRGLQADVIFLGIGGLGEKTDAYREAYWRETVDAVNPSRVIPIHYDSLTGPISGPMRGPVMIMALLSGGIEKVLPFLKEKERTQPSLNFHTLPRYREVILFN